MADPFLKQNAWVCLNQAEIIHSGIVRHEELLNPVSSNEYRVVQHQIPFTVFKTKVKNLSWPGVYSLYSVFDCNFRLLKVGFFFSVAILGCTTGIKISCRKELLLCNRDFRLKDLVSIGYVWPLSSVLCCSYMCK